MVLKNRWSQGEQRIEEWKGSMFEFFGTFFFLKKHKYLRAMGVFLEIATLLISVNS